MGILGALFILTGSIIPLANLNNNVITYLPVRDNFVLGNGLWQWRDISFFALTLFIIGILAVIFSIKKIFTGLMITGLVALFIIFILFAAIFEIKGQLLEVNGTHVYISWGWIILIMGSLLILAGGAKKSSRINPSAQ
jgi:hypothetical protein